MSDLVTFAALAVAAISLLVMRQQLRVAQGEAGRGLVLTGGFTGEVWGHSDGDLRTYTWAAHLVGPGVRHQMQVHLIGPNIEQSSHAEEIMTCTSEALALRACLPAERERDTWFVVTWVDHAPGGGIRTGAARSPLAGFIPDRDGHEPDDAGHGHTEVWKWYRTYRIRQWWQAKPRRLLPSTGKVRPLGRYRRERGRRLLAEQGPVPPKTSRKDEWGVPAGVRR
ncbi:hypothetical protein [Rhodococcus ruber]|uniref:hypothetical protein n=1 Tax=Rhodococcus ruber TaxID=1830 RepID=UPI00315DE480